MGDHPWFDEGTRAAPRQSYRSHPQTQSKRAAHWQTGRQVIPQGWPQFPQNGSMPRYMNDSRYFSLSNPIPGLDARSRNLALADASFAHISNEMDT